MPFSLISRTYWDVDPDCLSEIEGGSRLRDWFGFSTTFHDDEIVRASFDANNAELVIAAFQMTSETDEKGFFVQDRQVTVTIYLSNVTGIALEGKFPTQVLEMGFRKVESHDQTPKNSLVDLGDIELAFDDIYSGGGSIFAKKAKISFVPQKD